MQNPQDRQAFATAMAQLSMALNTIQFTDQHLDAYWTALSDLRIDGVLAACDHLARHFTPRSYERFPVPATIREHVYVYRKEQQQLARAQALLPAPDAVPDEEALAHVREILAMLDTKMEMSTAKAARPPETLDVAARKALLKAQAKQLEEHTDAE
jgi:hypothetical protein